MLRIFFPIFGLFLLGACNSYKSKLKPLPGESLTLTSISYQFVNAKVFTTRCLECHSSVGGNKGDVNLETYEAVVSQIHDIEEVVFGDQSMPPKKAGGPLGTYEKSILRLWIDAGVPREAGEPLPAPPTAGDPEVTPTPKPEPTPSGEFESIAPTWLEISQKIFQPKCLKCHSEGEKAEDYPLTDMTYVIDPANLMVVPGDPESSELYISIVRQDKKVMPPPKTGIKLTPQEIEAVRLWILNGAKD